MQTVGGEDYQQLYLPARLCRDSTYPLAPGGDVTVAVVAGVLVAGPQHAIDAVVDAARDAARNAAGDST
ncbi:hypothetical protein C478_07312 [Natrinema thermotolerans DSM 11552]|nr:hypothetical protein C478_07312 [Natrinema thermotolerans DSM 11552]